MHHTIRRAAIVAGATVATLALGTGSAVAHQCYIANRSDKGSTGADHSAVWWTVTTNELVGPGSAPGAAECFAAAVQEAGLPTTFAIMEKVPAPHEGVLGSKNPNATAKAGDGKGIDHLFTSGQIEQYIGMLIECGGVPPF